MVLKNSDRFSSNYSIFDKKHFQKIHMASQSFNPFLFYSNQLQTLFVKAGKQKNPALWLHQHNVRSILFMLEALTRLHDNAFNEKLFSKWQSRFKKFEDIFGEIEFNTSLETEFKKNKNINKEIQSRFANKAVKCIAKCNKRLAGKGWLTDRLLSFDDKLKEYTVVYDKVYLDELKVAIKEEIEGIVITLEKLNYSFTRMEKDVHEMRRRLRWLSIYGQALNGLIQLKKTTKKPKYQLNYFTKEIIGSGFNKLPSKPKNTAILEFDSNSFFALSWIINELGKLKDIGLKVEELSNAIFLYEDMTLQQAKEKAAKILGEKTSVEQDVLKKASNIVTVFVTKDKILDTLIVK